MLKPFDFERFHKAVIKAKEYFAFSNKSKNEVRYIYVRADYALIKIDCNEILFLESIDDYIKIHLLGKKPIMTLGTLKSMEEKLPNELFTRVHRSYIVSINKIESVKGKNIILVYRFISIHLNLYHIFTLLLKTSFNLSKKIKLCKSTKI